MKKTTIALAVACLIASGAAVRADEKNPVPVPAKTKSVWSSWFKDLKSTLSQSAVGGERKKGRTATSVAAVRGKRQRNLADPNEPSIKGDVNAEKAKKLQAIDNEFATAVEYVEVGKLPQGLKALEDFKEAHPSHRVDDVDKAIEGVKFLMSEKDPAMSSSKE
jgi:hypothetical protein